MTCLTRIHSFFNNTEINSIITVSLLFISSYTAIVTVLGQNFLNPLADRESPAEKNEEVRTIFVIFILLFGGLFATRTSKLLRLPQLFGCLLVGIVIRNIEILNQFFELPPFLETIIRKVALTMIVIRWGLATDLHFLFRNSITPVSIALISVIGEIIAVTAASFFILNISFIMSVFCALILVIVSPAVTVPSMISFKEAGLGEMKKIPENVLAVCCVDNLFCVILFMVLSSIVFTDASISTTILLNIGTIILGMLGGLLIGFILWIFPQSNTPNTELTRVLLIGTISISLMIGTYLIKYSCSGFISTLIISSMCSMKWKSNHELKTIESTFKFIWESFALPLLFICLGIKFQFSTLTLEIVLLCISVISIGLLVRTVFVMAVTHFSKFNFNEKIVIALSLLPRATFQADLAPTLLVMATPFPDKAEDAELIMKAAILSVLVTAPIFDILLNLVGKRCLGKNDRELPKDKLKGAFPDDEPLNPAVTSIEMSN
ncbi:unnamed protein product [Caenorhabditis brenneri]